MKNEIDSLYKRVQWLSRQITALSNTQVEMCIQHENLRKDVDKFFTNTPIPEVFPAGKLDIGIMGSKLTINSDGSHTFSSPEKPQVDWSAMPAWAEWFAIDEDGDEFWYVKEPELASTKWCQRDNDFGEIPSEYKTNWKGNWESSLTRRPK